MQTCFITGRAKVLLHLYPGQTYIWWWTFNYLFSNLILQQYRKRETVFWIFINVRSSDLPNLGSYLMISYMIILRFFVIWLQKIYNICSQISHSGDSSLHPLFTIIWEDWKWGWWEQFLKFWTIDSLLDLNLPKLTWCFYLNLLK